jgi:carbohydrate kinase (thermoresistant glucokinase family)
VIAVVMGVAGSGKSRVGAALAARLRCLFIDGDDYHPAANVEKMRSGTPLTDADRESWLDALAAQLDACRAAGAGCVLACSALKRRYRERLAAGHGDLRFVHLTAPRAVLEERLRARAGHFMPPALLESQLAALEPPGADEPAQSFSAEEPLEALVERIAAALSHHTR